MSIQPNTRPTRRAHSVATHPSARTHRRQVARWALANGHHVARDALTVLVALRTDPSTGTVDTRWSTADVRQVTIHSAALWCSAHGTALPDHLTSTLATYLRYLSAHRLLGAESDSIATLRRAVADLPLEGSRSRHPAGGSRAAPVVPIS